MKKLLIVGVLGIMLVAPFSAFADTATSTPAIPGGHQRAYMAGFVDSINNKGSWLLKNYQGMREIFYIAEHPELTTLWKQVTSELYK